MGCIRVQAGPCSFPGKEAREDGKEAPRPAKHWMLTVTDRVGSGNTVLFIPQEEVMGANGTV